MQSSALLDSPVELSCSTAHGWKDLAVAAVSVLCVWTLSVTPLTRPVISLLEAMPAVAAWPGCRVTDHCTDSVSHALVGHSASRPTGRTARPATVVQLRAILCIHSVVSKCMPLCFIRTLVLILYHSLCKLCV